MARKCKQGMLRSYDEYMERQQAPRDYHRWCLLSVISYALGRKCYINFHEWKIYPNLYVVLVGESGSTKKSTSQEMAIKLLEDTHEEEQLNISSQKLTPEYLIMWLKQREKKTGCADALIYADEFKNLVGNAIHGDDTIFGILTALFDSKDKWKYGTIKHGELRLNGNYVVLLAGSTISWLREAVPDSSWDGGFFSRVILVPRKPRGVRRALPHEIFPPEKRYIRDEILHDLQCVSKIEGEYSLSTTARDAFANWYETQLDAERAVAPRQAHTYYERKDVHVLKLAMCIAASRRDNRQVQYQDLEDAQMLLAENETEFEGLFRAVDQTKHGQALNWLEGVLEKAFSDTRRGDQLGYVQNTQLTTKTRHRLDRETLGKMLELLENAGLIEARTSTRRKGKPAVRFYETKKWSKRNEY